MRGKQLILKIEDNVCIIPPSHKLNADVYFRIRIANKEGVGRWKLVMYHRYVWEKAYGKIPEGYEIDHKCRNRSCCNLAHLQMLEGHEHAILGNTIRYKERKDKAREYWETHQETSGTSLASLFDVSFSTGCKWLREWKV